MREAQGSRDSEGGRKAAVLARFRGWEAPVEAIIEATREAAIHRIDVCDRPPVQRWGEGRVTLLGDAAHVMTPNRAQGACQAIEDGVVLADLLGGTGGAETALRAYDARRMRRTALFTNQSWYVGASSRLAHPLACAVRDRFLKFALNGPALRQHKRDMAADPRTLSAEPDDRAANNLRG